MSLPRNARFQLSLAICSALAFSSSAHAIEAGHTGIHAVQGSGASSPLAGSTVTVQGIVVGDFQNNTAPDSGNLDGFYLQEEDHDQDNDSSTSEGIFIYAPNALDVKPGDKVTVTGNVSEFFGMTQISASSVTIEASNQALPSITELTLPLQSSAALEAYEGMLVRFPQDLMISEYFNFDRFGEIVLALPLDSESRPLTGTAMDLPGAAANARTNRNALSRILLDDGRTVQNPDPAIHPNGAVFNLNNLFRGGDLVSNATGILDYRFNQYRLQPTAAADYTASNPRPLAPTPSGSISVASFNVLNYFTTLDGNGNICGPSGGQQCRGADNATEFQRQRDKILAALVAINADVVGLIEIENNTIAAVQDLVNGLNQRLGSNTYAFINTGTIGTDAIKQALIYKPARIAPSGSFAILDASVDANFIDDKNRPALAQTFREIASGGEFTVAVNHLKSKGSDCNSIGDPDSGDGSGNCNLTREKAAKALADWLATQPTGSSDPDMLIIGDLNAYDQEAPIRALIDKGYTDLIARDLGAEAYSYVFDGQFGYLDYAMANRELENQVTGVAIWHINADEPDLIDYDTSFKKPAQDALYAADAFRSSDHDPVIVSLNLSVTQTESALTQAINLLQSELQAGVLRGHGNNAATRSAFSNRVQTYLNSAAAAFDSNNSRLGCRYLDTLYPRVDGVGTDWLVVTGTSQFAARLNDARSENCR